MPLWLRTDPSGSRPLPPAGVVHKTGRTTGTTEGELRTAGTLIRVLYSGSQFAFFRDQFVVKPTRDNDGPFCDTGDSGSVVANLENEAIGLLVGVSPAQDAVVNPLDQVLDEVSQVLGSPLRLVTHP
jgi:hypothetical protein